MDIETINSASVISVPYVIEGVTAVGTVLAGAIYRLWYRIEHDHKFTRSELQKCLTEHSNAKIEIADIREELGFVRGRQDGIEDMAREVLETIARNDIRSNP